MLLLTHPKYIEVIWKHLMNNQIAQFNFLKYATWLV